MGTMSSPIDDKERKKLAAVLYALGWTRGVLYDVLDGDYSREDVQRIFDASATYRIAESIGLTEGDIVDLELMESLTEAEKEKIQGLP